MKPRFLITIINYHWSCGDGCCSDSGYKVEVEDLEPERVGYCMVYDNDDWENNNNPDYLEKRAIEEINRWIGRESRLDEYAISYEDKYSDEVIDTR